MLEAVNPLCPENIHVATVTKVKGQHMWIRLEGVTSTRRMASLNDQK